MDISKVKEQAEKELNEELFRKAVDEMKDKLRQKRSLWDKIFPYKIIFVRKEKENDWTQWCKKSGGKRT